MSIYLITVIAYLTLMVIISLVQARRVHGEPEEFMVGGRHVSTFMMVTTLIATWTGAGSLIGGAGLAYRQGYSELWMSVGAWAAIVVVYKLAGRVRHIAEYTLPDILEKRFGGAARLLGSLALIVGATTIVGYQFKGGAFVLELVAGIPWETGVALIAAMVILFTALAGMESIVHLDLVNGVLILVGIIIAVPLVYFGMGSVAEIKAALPPEHFTLLGGHSWVWAGAVFLPTFLLLLGEPSMYQKFFSTKDERTARRAVVGWIIGIIIVDVLICTIAILGRAKFPQLAAEGGAERVVLEIARFGLPTWAGVILLAAAIAVVFSTANSFLLAPATNLTHDIFQRFFARNASRRTVVIFNRFAVIFLGGLAYLLLTRFQNVLSMSLAAYTMIGAALTPSILAAFFWKRATKAGGLASIAGGFIATIATKVVFDMPGVREFFEMRFGIPRAELGEYIIIPAFLIALTLLVGVSLLTRRQSDERLAVFFNNK